MSRLTKGFSLIETLVALVFFSVTLLGLAHLILPVFDSVKRVKQSTNARFLVDAVYSYLEQNGFEKTYRSVSKNKKLLLRINKEGSVLEAGGADRFLSQSGKRFPGKEKTEYFVVIQAAPFYGKQNQGNVPFARDGLPENSLTYPEAYLDLWMRIYFWHQISNKNNRLEKILSETALFPQWDTFVTLNR